MFKSPFSKLTSSAEKNLTFFLVLATLIVALCLRYFDQFLINSVCPKGIVYFELAKDINTSEAILNSWNEQSKISSGLSLGLDYLFLILYSSLIAILIHKLNVRLWKDTWFYSVGVALIFSQFIAAFFDGIENYGLIRLLLGDIDQFWATLAYYFAVPKFIIIAIGIVYILVNTVLLLFKKRSINV